MFPHPLMGGDAGAPPPMTECGYILLFLPDDFKKDVET